METQNLEPDSLSLPSLSMEVMHPRLQPVQSMQANLTDTPAVSFCAPSSSAAAPFVFYFSTFPAHLALLMQREHTMLWRGASEDPVSWLELKGRHRTIFSKQIIFTSFSSVSLICTTFLTFCDILQMLSVVSCALQLTPLFSIYFIMVSQWKKSTLSYCYKWFTF